MNRSLLLLVLLLAAASAAFLGSKAQATPTGRAIVKHLSSVLKWTKPSPKTTHHDGDVVEFESGYFVETLVEGDKLGVVPHTIRVSPEGELFAVDATNNNIVRITPPLSQYSRARLVAGSFQGYSGHVDGKPSDARFYHPKGVTMDDKGNVYVADTSNLAIRKIGEAGASLGQYPASDLTITGLRVLFLQLVNQNACVYLRLSAPGVTTIAGGKSNIAGYRDGPSEDAKFSTDFDVVYVGRTCSLLVVDRGNAALRQISLQQEDCEYQYSSVSTSDIIMVIGAVLAGYVSCLLQHGFGPLISHKNQAFESAQHEDNSLEKPTLVVETLKEEPGAGWPSLGRLLVDLSKFAVEGIGNMLLNLIPFGLRRKRSAGLTPLKDHLVMPEDKAKPPLVQKQKSPSPLSETLHEPNVVTETVPKPQKSSKVPKFKDPSLPSKHRSSKRQEYADFYGSVEAQVSSKPQKDRVRHRHRDKSSEALFGAVGTEPKSVEMKSADYSDPKFDHYNIRSKYGPDNTFRY